jgi:esterase/lipase
MRAVRAQFINTSATTLKEFGVDVESTNNTTVGNMMHVSAPWVLFAGTADDKINIAELIYNEAKSKDKKIIVLRGATHGTTSVDPKRFLSTPALRKLMDDEIAKWVNERFK